jgi:hypothetical protein
MRKSLHTTPFPFPTTNCSLLNYVACTCELSVEEKEEKLGKAFRLCTLCTFNRAYILKRTTFVHKLSTVIYDLYDVCAQANSLLGYLLFYTFSTQPTITTNLIKD